MPSAYFLLQHSPIRSKKKYFFFLLIKKYWTRPAPVLARHQSDDLHWQFIIWVTCQQGQESLKLTSPQQAEFHYIVFLVKICFLRGQERVINRLDTSQALRDNFYKLSYFFNPVWQIAFIVLRILHILTNMSTRLQNYLITFYRHEC